MLTVSSLWRATAKGELAVAALLAGNDPSPAKFFFALEGVWRRGRVV